MNVKYIKFNGKHPKETKENRHYYDTVQPEWYDYGHTAFNVGMMDTFMDKTIVSAASTLNSSPSDSGGSGGGGSSGGGSGGGGGVSW